MRLSAASISSFDRLNDLHSAAAARTGWRVVGRSDLFTTIGAAIHKSGGRHQQLAAERDLIGTVAVGEQAVVTDAMEAVRRVHQNAPNELTGLERHHFALAVLAIILPAKADLPVGQRDQPAIGDCNAMSAEGARAGREDCGAWTLRETCSETGSRSIPSFKITRLSRPRVGYAPIVYARWIAALRPFDCLKRTGPRRGRSPKR
jgi:hypothetical protein